MLVRRVPSFNQTQDRDTKSNVLTQLNSNKAHHHMPHDPPLCPFQGEPTGERAAAAAAAAAGGGPACGGGGPSLELPECDGPDHRQAATGAGTDPTGRERQAEASGIFLAVFIEFLRSVFSG